MPQFARPSADTVRTGWTDQAGGTTDIYTTIDEAVADDNDYIKTAAPPGSNEFETLLTPVTDPLSSTGHIMRWRRRKQPASGSAQINLTVRLLEGATQIKSVSDVNIPGTFTDTSATLSTAEADAITDYSNLRLEFVATQV
jgi:hypothetical protein